MIQLDPAKLAKLKTADELFNERYGLPGTPAREAFEQRALSWYYGELLKGYMTLEEFRVKAKADLTRLLKKYGRI